MALKSTNSAQGSLSSCLSLPQPRPICPNACCLIHEIRTNELPKGTLRPLFYRNRAVVIEQGHPVSGCYSICSGWVKVAQRTRDGKIAGLDVRGPGDLIGAHELLADEPLFDFYTQALCETQIVWIQRASLLDLLRRRPDFALKFSQQVAQTAGAVQRRFAHMLHAGLESQIAYLLNYLHEKRAFVQNEGGADL